MRAPTKRMQTLASSWLTDTIRIGTLTESVDVDPDTGQPTTTGYTQGTRALVRQATATRDTGNEVEFQIRDLTVWIGMDATVSVGDAFTVTTCAGDSSLNGATGTVTDVERDSVRACRRFGVRLDNTV